MLSDGKYAEQVRCLLMSNNVKKGILLKKDALIFLYIAILNDS